MQPVRNPSHSQPSIISDSDEAFLSLAISVLRIDKKSGQN